MLKLENVSKYYYSSSSVTCALRKINLQLNIGEFVTITGESGSGKTTLLNILSGLDSYEDGEMYYYDKKTSFFDAEDWENYRKNEIAFIFQNYNLIDSFTVLENVIVPYIIEGFSYKEAKIKAKETLKLVGLENDYHKKATKLSGGQKQRLSIARALAKETNIIVADEPTGNLDIENGKAILELLKKLSKDKLVIVVSHNLSQIEPYITRKIRLHDGEIVLDEVVEQVDNIKVDNISKNEVNKYKQAFNFSLLNLKSQPKKTILVLLLTLICVLSSFVFYANFKANIDDNKTKELETDFFLNFDDTRLIVRNVSGEELTNERINEANVKYVKSVEKYDYITDVNYYRLGDYKWILGGGFGEPDPVTGEVPFFDSSSITLVDNTKFMRSAYSLNESDLLEGRLPTGRFEMVVYSDDPSIIGTKEVVLFLNRNSWGEDAYLKYTVEIVGILKERTKQAYFSDDLCMVMQFSQLKVSISINYFDKNGRLKALIYNKVGILQTENGYAFTTNKSKFQFIANNAAAIPAQSITYNISHDVGKDEASINCENYHEVCIDGVMLSYDYFIKIYNKYCVNDQFTIFIEDYCYTDDVMKELVDLNFDSLSCFRASVSGYDITKVIVRYANLVISLVALFLMNLIIVFIGLSILKVKKNDYVIFKMIGVTNKLIKKINIFELVFYCLISNIVLVITYIIVKNKRIIDTV